MSRPGSSPLTRGKLVVVFVVVVTHRLIPAHAGKTCPFAPAQSPSGAHPRSRGENHEAHAATVNVAGSSPLTRGKRHPLKKLATPLGLIPAHAGKTMQRGRTSTSARAHPRSRGENRYPVGSESWCQGSSPLTRGKHFLTCAFIAQIGQILESLELCASSESYSSPEAYATDALQGRVRSIDLGLRSSRGAS